MNLLDLVSSGSAWRGRLGGHQPGGYHRGGVTLSESSLRAEVALL